MVTWSIVDKLELPLLSLELDLFKLFILRDFLQKLSKLKELRMPMMNREEAQIISKQSPFFLIETHKNVLHCVSNKSSPD